MRRFKRAAVVGIGLLAFSGAAVGASQAADTPPEGKEYTVHDVHNCEEAINKSVKELGTPPDGKEYGYSCMMNGDMTAADLRYSHK
ncbi:hypothetical protein [Streptomyces sp. ODS28]|uniref:hypothetical protein n=1 Tax=Streptomyces sp. ODS28 TaxID=3136688 RepID=UPI0031EDF138